ncbi:hypothetical protein [Proteus terrae]|uniref:transcriptional antitermination N peptide n=1 Tax=Proteus terrae TaxID=1574161 RepID=UPI0018E876A5|nr:hypothetical protein [Proteus terrae]MBJ2110762.1 hypothetical protein [Proteus terrae]MBJ2134333.1 hypothetical protein [Proteus terrae]
MCIRGYNCARSRRADRRTELQNAYAMNEQLKVAIHGKPKEEIKRPTLSLTRKPVSRVEKAISIRSTKVYDSVDNCCLPNVAVFSGVKTKQPSSEFGVTAR